MIFLIFIASRSVGTKYFRKLLKQYTTQKEMTQLNLQENFLNEFALNSLKNWIYVVEFIKAQTKLFVK